MARRDDLLMSALHGTAWRRAVEQADMAATLVELRGLAAGRNDLLAQVAGVTAGAWSADPARHVGTELLVAGLLIAAGHRLSYDDLARWVEVGRQRGMAARRPYVADGSRGTDSGPRPDLDHRPQ